LWLQGRRQQFGFFELGLPFSSRADGRGISSWACTSLFRAKYLRADFIFRSESAHMYWQHAFFQIFSYFNILYQIISISFCTSIFYSVLYDSIFCFHKWFNIHATEFNTNPNSFASSKIDRITCIINCPSYPKNKIFPFILTPVTILY